MREHGHSPVFHAAIDGNQEKFKPNSGRGGHFSGRSI
jgi:hypothetical protein